MENKIMIQGVYFSEHEINEIIKNSPFDNYEYVFIDELGLSPIGADVVCITIQLLQSVGFSFIYDVLKYTITNICNIIHKRDITTDTIIAVTKDGKTRSMNFSFKLTEEERKKAIDAAVMAFCADE